MDLFDSDAMKKSFPDLIEKFYNDYATSGDQVSLVGENTREQANSRIWYQQRSGYVTASTLKGPIATDPSKPSLSFIRSVCYPDLHSLKSAACNMELTMKVLHERSIRKEFLRWMANIQIVIIGVIIELLYPFMGATPHAL